ncbi:MAG: DUF559 domain-containing protein [Candidatus Methanoperedens sp.]|nr:MAG: hypothetical protein OI719_00355 [Candidatus Methanoperedens sp.]
MAWNDIFYKTQCCSCYNIIKLHTRDLLNTDFIYKCPYCSNYIKLKYPPQPNLPNSLYIGPEKLKRIKLLPLPPKNVIYEGHGKYHQFFGDGDCGQCHYGKSFPDSYGAPMDCGFTLPDQIQPYSVRSFLTQLSLRKDFPCKYFVHISQEDVYGKIILKEGCMKSCGGCNYRNDIHPCHVANGWIHGEESCSGWEYIANLCQSENERRFLHQYLRINHDRESPMPIPQAHIEITERIRVDFVIFVPITRFKWKWLAIEIDSRFYHQDSNKDLQKNIMMESQGYEVIRLSAEKMMLDQVRELCSKITEIQSAFKRRGFNS